MGSLVADVVVGLQFGDEGKGKVSHHLAKTGEYTHVLRFNGGCNAGHTIYHEGKKFVTHHIPCGVFFGIKSIIGHGCVLNIKQFMSEIDELERNGINVKPLIGIASHTNVITDFHVAQDSRDTKIGTTKRGNGPAYRDKYARKGLLAIEVPELAEYIVDLYTEFHDNPEFEDVKVLCEGAQGFGLDIDWGDYPYVTSSHCTAGSVTLNGITCGSIRNVWGVAKVYSTYVGAKQFEGQDPDFEKLRKIGDEFGSTTGRPRQIDWLDMDMIKMAVKINGVNKLVFNKVDILEELGIWRLYSGPSVEEFNDAKTMHEFILSELSDRDIETMFSCSPYEI